MICSRFSWTYVKMTCDISMEERLSREESCLSTQCQTVRHYVKRSHLYTAVIESTMLSIPLVWIESVVMRFVNKFYVYIKNTSNRCAASHIMKCFFFFICYESRWKCERETFVLKCRVKKRMYVNGITKHSKFLKGDARQCIASEFSISNSSNYSGCVLQYAFIMQQK